jgi:uncharacterized protein with von Willebrand factor type A (vWA) domain
MIFLWNPTNEDFGLTYGGLSYSIMAGKRLKVEEAMGNHALNALGSRGLTKLVFDDEGHSVAEEQIGQDAIERNKEFKIKQIVTYNERNERRKASGQPYDTPTPIVKKYAVELGIELLQPYNLALAERGQIGALSKENEDLKEQLKQQSDNISKLMESMKNMEQTVSGGFVKAGVIEEKTTGYVTCKECGEQILPNRLKSHMKAKHKR